MIPEWLPVNWVTLSIAAVGLLYMYIKWKFDFWKKRNIPFLKPNILFGNYTDVFLSRTTVGELMEHLYKTFEGKPFAGFWRFQRPGLLVRDEEAVKAILLKEFNNFNENGFYVDPHLDPLISRNPFFRAGDRWKNTRQMLTPSFTASKLKPLMPLMEEVSAQLLQFLRTDGQACGPDGLEAKELASKYTMEMVATCAFGIRGDSFNNPNAELRTKTMQVFSPGLKKSIEIMITNFLPTLGALLKIRIMAKEIDEFYRRIIRDVTGERIKTNTTRNDYLQNLILLKKKAEESGEIYTDEDITAHAVTFMTDGFETSSITLGFILYELARHPDVQEELWREVTETRHENGGKLPFEALMDMPLLDQVISESLRLHPPLMAMEKVCTADTTLRAADGSQCRVRKGQLVVLPVLGFHMDPRLFPDPQRFDPARFSPQRRALVPKYLYLPFGEGPRMCLGMRFALQQMKLAITTIAENFVIKTTPKTPKTVEQDPTYFLACAKGGLWVRFEERKPAN